VEIEHTLVNRDSDRYSSEKNDRIVTKRGEGAAPKKVKIKGYATWTREGGVLVRLQTIQ
jgi:hypothetical protein